MCCDKGIAIDYSKQNFEDIWYMNVRRKENNDE